MRSNLKKPPTFKYSLQVDENRDLNKWRYYINKSLIEIINNNQKISSNNL